MNKIGNTNKRAIGKATMTKLTEDLCAAVDEKKNLQMKLVIAKDDKVKREAELIIANVEKAKRATELVIADAEKVKRADELIIADKELNHQNKDKVKRAAELVIANMEKAKRASELVVANIEKAKRAAELVVANIEKAKRAKEASSIKKELVLAKEKEKLVDELTYANKALKLQIKERKLAEKELLQSYIFSESILKTIPFGMDIVDETGTILFQSNNFKKIFGENAIGNKCWELYRDDKKQCSDCPLINGIAVDKTDVYESHGVLGNRIFDISHTGIMYKGKKAMLEIFQDITDRKIKEAELIKAKGKALESERYLENIINTMGDPIFVKDDQSRLLIANDAFCELFGLKKDTIIGRTLDKDVRPEEQECFLRIDKKVLEDGIENVNEELLTVRGGSPKTISTKKTRFIDENGRKFLVGIIRDITNRKKTEMDLLYAKEKAEESDRLKSAFLTNMSHEIRTPMNGILGFTELLQTPDLSEKNQIEYIEIISKSSERLLNTVNDIIEISKIESGGVEINKTKVDVISYLETLVTFFKPEIQKRGLKIVVENEIEQRDLNILVDKTKLDSILSNLIKNAIKYTDEGFIKVGFKLKDNQIVFVCQDSGIGVQKDRLEAIFNRFEQADIEDKQVREGSGLGLAIVKSYVEMLGGKIWVESEIGKGSTFYVSLPYNPVKAKKVDLIATKKSSDTVNKNINVLIVEDDEASSMHLSIITKEIFKNIASVTNGKEAVEFCKNDSSIDLIFMDLKMPTMNGFEATKRIREFNKDVVIIAQTAYIYEKEKQKALDAGCNDFITKPIIKDKLIQITNKYI